MKIEDVEQAVKLKKDIQDLEYFIENVLKIDTISINYISFALKKHTKTSYSLFGSRDFGGGSHVKEVSIPRGMATDIKELSEKRLGVLKLMLESL